MYKVECVNDQGKPNDIPNNQWIKKGNQYTVIKADYLNMQNRILGFQLEEVSLEGCFPYLYFAANRFKPLTEDDVNAEETVKELLEEQYQLI